MGKLNTQIKSIIFNLFFITIIENSYEKPRILLKNIHQLYLKDVYTKVVLK
jgi:hypothetical protein